VPNGAIVPVRAGIGCTVARTVLSVIAATQYLGHALDATEARPVAIVEETVDRSTAGLILAKLDPNMFIYQEQHGTALLVGTGTTAAAATQTVNRIRVSSAQTAGLFVPFEIRGESTGTGAGGICTVLMRANCTGTAIAGMCYANWSQVTLDTGAVVTAGHRVAGALLKTHVLSTAGTQLGDIYAAHFCVGLDKAVTGKTAQMYFESQTSVGEHVDYWFVTRGGSPGEDIGFVENATLGANAKVGAIKIYFGSDGAARYINVYSTATS